MTAEKLLEQVEVEPGDAGPDRVAYRLTEDGEREFHLLLGTALSDPEVGHPELSAAISLMTALPRKRVIGMLSQRLVHLEAEGRRAKLLIEEGSEWGQPAHISELFRLWAEISAAPSVSRRVVRASNQV
jgi:DNA-binding PadR family transcriptional regulator